MVPLIIIRIFLFALVPAGIFLLVKGIRLLSRSFNGEMIIEVPFTHKSTIFSIPGQGTYAIWQKGKIFQKTPANQFRPVIINTATNKEVPLSVSLLAPNTNNGSTGRMMMFSFQAEPGSYQLNLADGSSISRVESVISDSISRVAGIRSVAPHEYFIQIRKSQPAIMTLLGLLLSLAGGIITIGGFVLGLLAGKLFN